MTEQKIRYGVDEVMAQLNLAVNQAGESTKRQCYYALYENPADPNGEPVDYDAAMYEYRVLHGYDAAYGWEPTPVAPHCIVGTVLHNLGAPLEALREYEGTSVGGGMHRTMDLPFEVAQDGWEILGEAQNTQDDGHDWGQARKSAERTLTDLRESNHYFRSYSNYDEEEKENNGAA